MKREIERIRFCGKTIASIMDNASEVKPGDHGVVLDSAAAQVKDLVQQIERDLGTIILRNME